MIPQPLKKFKKIYIEITNRCNLSCSFCLRSERPKAFMPPEEFRAILGKIKDHTGHLALHVLGEPLLHPELGEILALCHAFDLKVNLTTNGTLLPQSQGLLLASPALRQVNISLHGLAELPDSPDQETALAGVFAFVREAMRTPLFISLRLWNLSAEEGSGRNQRILNRITEFFALPKSPGSGLTPGHGLTLAPKVFLSQNARFTWPHDPSRTWATRAPAGGCRIMSPSWWTAPWFPAVSMPRRISLWATSTANPWPRSSTAPAPPPSAPALPSAGLLNPSAAAAPSGNSFNP